MLHVSLEQVRRGRQMDLASELRMERDMVRHCFYTQHLNRSGMSSETVEGIRALAGDKDHQPSGTLQALQKSRPRWCNRFSIVLGLRRSIR